MNIKILYDAQGAQQAEGLAIVIDVFRAATTAAYLLDRGATFILPVSTKEEAFALIEKNPDYILVGEEGGYKIEGFDIGNSPFEISKLNLKNKVAVFRTSQGTQGVVNALKADKVIFGSFPYATAIVDFINQQKSDIVSLIVMGGIGSKEINGKGGEDEKFAEFLQQRLGGKKPEMKPIIEYLKTHEGSRRFLDPNIPEFPSEDFSLCLQTDVFNFVPLVKKQGNQLVIIKQQA